MTVELQLPGESSYSHMQGTGPSIWTGCCADAAKFHRSDLLLNLTHTDVHPAKSTQTCHSEDLHRETKARSWLRSALSNMQLDQYRLGAEQNVLHDSKFSDPMKSLDQARYPIALRTSCSL